MIIEYVDYQGLLTKYTRLDELFTIIPRIGESVCLEFDSSPREVKNVTHHIGENTVTVELE
jgi:hypothetical protein